ncbi:MAG TPA: hypothetical protein VFH82_05520 [Gemmatimonadota bacterium]|nr:hypothetical protein [Gemmatimonadota bacterium]
MTPARGAYGFRLVYPEAAEPPSELIDVDGSSPVVTVTWRHASTVRDIEEVSDERVVYGFRGATTYYVEREPPIVRFDVPYVPPLGAFVHPLLTIGISVLARWRGDVTLHAGAFETDSGAWGFFGAREAGKSSMLASLGERGYPVVADDLLAIQDGLVWAGPSCVDLRPDTAARFPGASYMGIVGGRPRWRLATASGRFRSPLRGFFVLDRHEDPGVTVEPLTTQERLQWMYRQEYIRLVGFADPSKMVPLLTLPAWRLRRPRDWEVTQQAVDRILETTREWTSRTIGSASPG